MLDTEDIKKMGEYLLLVFKDVFATKEDIQEIKTELNLHKNAIDGLAGQVQALSIEVHATNHRIDKIEDALTRHNILITH
ncbi:MAG TPA: hypothetical protein VEA59_01215 [Patescibacteria group bacterium]|nr:hypothetical protein [Patescibacteria group bacterium]